MSIPAFIEYISLEKNFSNHTVQAYQSNIKSFNGFIESLDIKNNLEDASYGEIRLWIVNLIKSGNSSRTVNRKINALGSYYKFLLRIGRIKVSPLKRHRALKNQSKLALPISKDEINSLLESNVFSKNYTGVLKKTLINILYHTGIRRSELLNLKVNDVDFSKGFIKVLGKTNKERLIPLLPEIVCQMQDVLNLQTKKIAKYISNQKDLFLLFKFSNQL